MFRLSILGPLAIGISLESPLRAGQTFQHPPPQSPSGISAKPPSRGRFTASAFTNRRSLGSSRPKVFDWVKLVDALRSGKGPGPPDAGLIWKPRRDLIDDDNLVAKLADGGKGFDVSKLKFAVWVGLGEILDRPDFYDETAFKGVALSKERKELLAAKRTPAQTIWMNRALLSTAFPDTIAPPPPAADYHVTRVKVKAGQDVVLVLSSYDPCRWVVEVEKGGRVAGIVLSGHHPQEVVGVEVPVIYRAFYGPDGKETKKGSGSTPTT